MNYFILDLFCVVMRKAKHEVVIIFVIYFIVISIFFVFSNRDLAFNILIYSVLPFCMALIGHIKGSEGKSLSDSCDSLSEEAQKIVKVLRWSGFVVFFTACVIYYFIGD